MEMEDCDSVPRIREFVPYFNSINILEGMKGGRNAYPFTSYLVYFAEDQGLTEGEKKFGMMKVIRDLKRFCRRYEDDMGERFLDNVRIFTDCARSDIRNGDYYLAISDVNAAERGCLFRLNKQLSQIRHPDVRNMLIQKMVDSQIKMLGMDGYIRIKTDL
jgi:hypothetical protein